MKFNIKVRRYLNKDKKEVIQMFEKELKPKLKLIIKPSYFSEPIFYSIYIRSSQGLLGMFSYKLQKALKGNTKKALYFSLGVEALSSIILILDDLFDDDKLRSGVPSVWKKYGKQRAIISSFLSANEILNKCKEIDKNIYKILNESLINSLKFFEIEKRYYREPNKITTKRIEKLATYFTSFSDSIFNYLRFNTSMNTNGISLLRKFNKELSVAWYLSNALEIFDYKEGDDEKKISDFLNRYYTFPVVVLISKMNERDKRRFHKIFGNKRYINEFYSLMKKYYIKRECIKIIKKHYNKAITYLKKWKNSCDIKIDRDLRKIFKVYNHLPLVDMNYEI